MMKIVLAGLLTILLLYSEVSAAQLYGQVFLRDGRPAVNELIRVEGMEGREYRTDHSGLYFLDLPPGQYFLMVRGERIEVLIAPRGTRKDIYLP